MGPTAAKCCRVANSPALRMIPEVKLLLPTCKLTAYPFCCLVPYIFLVSFP